MPCHAMLCCSIQSYAGNSTLSGAVLHSLQFGIHWPIFIFRCGAMFILLVCDAKSLLTVQILRDFKLPKGTSEEDVDANGDGEVLAVLDLGTDDSLVEAGLAREVVNRVQKLRKKAGLVASDIVDVFLDARPHSDGKPGNNSVWLTG